MSSQIRCHWRSVLLLCGATVSLLTASLSLAAGTADNQPRGRQPVAIVDGQYPASYFPNTELLGADEMRITALGTGMPNQTKAAVSISYLVELGNGDKFLFDMGLGSMGNLFPFVRIFPNSTRSLPATCT